MEDAFALKCIVGVYSDLWFNPLDRLNPWVENPPDRIGLGVYPTLQLANAVRTRMEKVPKYKGCRLEVLPVKAVNQRSEIIHDEIRKLQPDMRYLSPEP